ncbi:zf-TFIIB domain-containing protein [Paenibacillus alvei]|uniref:Zf-TFIIB domain-containing protein n=1 Tax=Paenibacillus alvei TaxID=44250 RepID=A0ABT4H0E4_PAEAL|nr:zf-TFIIB domain-containing protein [Paenibacillus alvei]MCY9543951.1 zf-TFIIB domain-containing protein [Paenibacillus alvei]MCY9705934.1 zf-TFIIB domain-containing protein [Paenibacillus alvei]MCY9737752.1 zf-TFIIB domain-containing protein [Paenibacillus alvei]MCY9754706.1 zf-TFIIB domain-containing protein [Paenibacillus alvei]MCY9762389.1 zf-TFIIB domain-containing protein [Paenibacillus alvei]
MNCPICNNVRMREVEKEGVVIDVCPDCKGVWLDRGELEKLMSDVREERKVYKEWYDEDDRRSQKSDYPYHSPNAGYPPHYKHKKKKSVLDRLGDIFD